MSHIFLRLTLFFLSDQLVNYELKQIFINFKQKVNIEFSISDFRYLKKFFFFEFEMKRVFMRTKIK